MLIPWSELVGWKISASSYGLNIVFDAVLEPSRLPSTFLPLCWKTNFRLVSVNRTELHRVSSADTLLGLHWIVGDIDYLRLEDNCIFPDG